jgi:aminopeptidase N
MAQWVGADALGRVATLAYPARVVQQATADASAAALAAGGGHLTPAVRRSIVDADSELREALRSRAVFG